MLKQLKILLAISFSTTVIAVGMFFDNNKSTNINESSPLIENFDEILANLNYIEFSNQNDSTIIELINDQWLLSNSDNFLTNVVLPAPEGEDKIIITPSFSDGIKISS